MEKITFSTIINAPAEKVWHCLWDKQHYQTWVSAFSEDSTVQTDNWEEGSKILFVDSNGSGMMSTIVANHPHQLMLFKHLGMIINGVEDMTSDAAKAWNGSQETYQLQEENGCTTVTATLDCVEDMKDYFTQTFPVALKKLKDLTEGTIKLVITIKAAINAPVAAVWESWTTPAHIMQWNHASPDWHCPASTNDVRTGGKFSSTMAAKDGSFSFDFGGDYNEVKEQELIDATLGDGRMWKTRFKADGNKTIVTERFEAEGMHPPELQQNGWQAILNNFKFYTEKTFGTN